MSRPAVIVALMLATAPAASQAQHSPPPKVVIAGDRTAPIPIEINVGHILFQARLGDSLVWLALDTGAGHSLLDTGHAKRFGIAMEGDHQVFGAGGAAQATEALDVRIEFAGLTLRYPSVPATPLEFLASSSGRRIAGILGHDVFERFVVELDYARGTMRLHDPSHYVARKGAVSVPLTFRSNLPYVRAQVRLPDGMREEEFVIDTGSGATLMLAADFAAAHGLPGSLEPRIESRAGGVGGEMAMVAARLPAVRLGRFEVKNPVVLFPSGHIAAPGMAGNIGGGLLGRFVVTFDYSRRRMLLEPNDKFGRSDEFDMSGITLSVEGDQLDRYRVKRIRQGTPAAEVGLAVGDFLRQVNGHPAAELGMAALRDLLRSAQVIELVVERDGEARPVTLKTRRML